MYLWRNFVPKLDWKINIRGAKGAYESIFERLNGTFGGIDAVVTRFDELEAALLWGEVGFYCFCCLIVHDVNVWGEPFADEIFKVLFVCL